jgi:periplasmic protein CpxP/Spy
MPYATIKHTIAGLLAVLICSMPAFAQDPSDRSADAQQKVAAIKERLNLTSDQEAKIKPLAEQRQQQLQGLRSKYSSDSSREDKQKMLQDARQIQEDFESQVEPILNSDQLAEWQKMKDESKAARQGARQQ